MTRGADQWLAKNFPFLFGGSVGGGGSSDPFDVLNELDLTAISDEEDGKYYTVRDKFWSGATDVGGMIDQSHGRLLGTVIWASDFSVDDDGFPIIDGAGVATFGITQAGETNCMKITSDNIGVDRHRLREALLVSGKTYKVTAKTYMPSSNSVWDGWQWQDPTTSKFTILRFSDYENPITPDTWEADAFYITADGANFDFLPYDGSTSNASPNLDEFYLKDIIITEVTGNHFAQFTPASKPHRNLTDNTLDFDGVGMNLIDINGDFATAVASDTAGMVTVFIRDDVGTGVKCDIFSFNASGGTHRIDMELRTSDKIRIQTIISGVFQFIDFPITRGVAGAEWFKIQFGNDGTNFKCWINGVDTAFDGGTDSNIWLNSFPVAISSAVIGRNYSVGFGNFGLRHFGYCSGRVLTSDEIAAINSSSTYTEP